MKKSILVCFALQALVVSSLHASVATDANQLLGGLTTYDLRDYENIYDSTGALVTTRLAQQGDTIQGVFVITQVSNQNGTANYAPNAGGGAVELTGVFDEYISSTTVSGSNVYYNLTPDFTTAVGSGSQAKFMSGATFQTTFGTGSMIAVYQNGTNAMPVGTNGNGLIGLSTAQALALATSGAGTKWATFGAMGATGGTAWGSNYYWQGLESTPGVASFAASLGFIQNDTGIATSQFLPLTQSPPTGSPTPGLGSIADYFIIQGTTNPVNLNLNGTAYTVFSTDPAQINFVPEPTGILVMGGLFGLWGLGLAAYRRLRNA